MWTVLTVFSDNAQRTRRRREEHVELKKSGLRPRIVVFIYVEGLVSVVELEHTPHTTPASLSSRYTHSTRLYYYHKIDDTLQL